MTSSKDFDSNYGISTTHNSLDPDFLLCSEWSTKRVIIEIFLVIVLIENLFSMFVIATTAERRGSPFIIRCIRIINTSSLLMVLQLLFYPFVFSWDDSSGIDYDHFEEDNLNLSVAEDHRKAYDEDLHRCRQAHKAACSISGLMFGLVVFLPLLCVLLMTIDTTLAAFRWKMYRFRPKTASVIRISLFVGFSLALFASFLFPTIGLGTHYHYHELFKICWLSAHKLHFNEEGFIYYIFGYGCFLVFLVCCFGYLVLKAYKAELSPSRQMIGYECKVLFNRYIVMKSRSWTSYVRFVLWMDLLAIAVYFPLTAGSLIIFQTRVNSQSVYWLESVTELCVFFLPTAGPILLVLFYKSHRERAMDIFWWFYNKFFIKSNQSVSPTPTNSITSDSSSDPYTDSGYKALPNVSSTGPKLHSDSLKKQMEEEDKRGILHRFVKSDQLKQLSSTPKRKLSSTNYLLEPPNDIYGPSSPQKPYSLASQDRLSQEHIHRLLQRQSLQESKGLQLPRADLSQRRRSYELHRPLDIHPPRYYKLHLSPGRKRRSPRRSGGRKAVSHRDSALPLSNRYDDSSANNRVFDTNYSNFNGTQQQDTFTNAQLNAPFLRESESNYPLGASAFSQVDEQGFMWSSDHLKIATHRQKRHSKDNSSGSSFYQSSSKY